MPQKASCGTFLKLQPTLGNTQQNAFLPDCLPWLPPSWEHEYKVKTRTIGAEVPRLYVERSHIQN